MIKDILPILLKASIKTVELTVITVVLGSLIGIIVALLKLSKIKPIKWIASFYTWIIRGTPMLLQLIFFYYGLPFLGIELGPMGAAIIGLSLNSGAYMAERSEEHTSELQSRQYLVCRLLLEKKKLIHSDC